MVATALLLGWLAAASYTDVRWRKIYNGTTYSGALAALAGSAAATWFGVDAASGGDAQVAVWGFVSLAECVAGLAVCGAAMLACYVFFPGGVGGGDVKMIAMTGAFLGPAAGLEAMLWTFVLGGCAVLVILVWRAGAWRLAKLAAIQTASLVRWARPAPVDDATRRLLRAPLMLSPSALAAVLIVRLEPLLW